MFKKYDPRRVKSYRSYKLADICRLFKDKKLHPQTIRGWINDNKLEAFIDGKNLMVYGATLKIFLQKRNEDHKRKMAFDEFRCGKCKVISSPLNYIITNLNYGKAGCVIATGICYNCNNEMTRIYKKDQEPEIIQRFNIQHNELSTLSNRTSSSGKTHYKEEEKPMVSESCKSDKNIKNLNMFDTTSKTHQNPNQLSLF